MSDTIKGAIIGALITVAGSLLVFFLGNFSTQETIEKHTVETLSEYLDAVDKDMSYKQAMQSLQESYIALEAENRQLQKQLSTTNDENKQLQEQLGAANDEIDLAKKEANEEVITSAKAFADADNYEKAVSILSKANERTPEMEGLLADYSEKYESQIINAAILLQEEDKHDEAVATIDNALKIIDSDVLVLEKERVLSEKPQLFMDVCSPYEVPYNFKKYTNGETFQMAGQSRTNGFTFYATTDAKVLSNLGGQYKELSFVLGHVDGSEMYNATLAICLDGILHKEYVIKPDDLPISLSIPIEGVHQIMFLTNYEGLSPVLGFADMMLR